MSSRVRLASHDTETVKAFLSRFQCELQHTPGLALTPAQAARLFALPPDVCAQCLALLAQQGDICVRPDGRFVSSL